MVTTESATAAATLVNRPAGSWALPVVDRVTFDVVNASTTSAVLRPMTPPMPPITSAIATKMPSAK
ncbi:Uncharacterised protein [Mycobacterium tuberculosis]|nr:Uncharacterised protein [Mycobacterium tuberculosis]